MLVALLVIGGLVAGIFQDGRPLRHSAGSSLRGHDKFVGTLCYGADGRTLLTSGWDRQVRIWKVDEVQSDGATEIQSLPHDWHVYSIAVSPDGKYLAAGGVGGFSIWSWRDGLEWRRVKDQKGVSCRMLTISPDGRTLALACTDLTIRLWDLAAMAELRKLRDVSGELRSIAFSPEGALLAASTFSGNLRIWDLAAMNPEPIASRIPGSVRSFAFVPGSRSLAIADSGCEGNALSIWDVDGAGPRSRIAGGRAENAALAVSPDGKTLAAADQDKTIWLWDLATWQLKGSFHEGVGWVRTLVFSPDGRQLAFVGQSGHVQFRGLDLNGRPLKNELT